MKTSTKINCCHNKKKLAILKNNNEATEKIH